MDDTTELKTLPEKFPCSGCAFSYTVSVKGLIRKHNSRTGPGLCDGAQKPPRVILEEMFQAPADHVHAYTYADVVNGENLSFCACGQRKPENECACGGVETGCPNCDSDTLIPDVPATAVDPELTVCLGCPDAFTGRADHSSCITITQAPDPFTAPAPVNDIPDGSVSQQPEPDRDRWSRYLISGTAHTRATTFAKSCSDTFSLSEWGQRMVVRGLTLRPDLLALAHGLDVKQNRKDLNSIAEQAKEAAGQKVAANLGSAYHAFSERLDAGLMKLEEVPETYRGRLAEYLSAMSGAGLTTRPEWIERTTAVRADQVGEPVAGTLDRIVQLPNGELVIADLKTGSDLSYGWGEIAVQLALYAHGVNTHGLFDWRTKTWDTVTMMGESSYGAVTVRTDYAIVMHLPADKEGCTLYRVDIEAGWEYARLCGHVRAFRKNKQLARPLELTDIAAPVAAADVPEHVQRFRHAVGLVEDASGRDQVVQLMAYAAESAQFRDEELEQLQAVAARRWDELIPF